MAKAGHVVVPCSVGDVIAAVKWLEHRQPPRSLLTSDDDIARFLNRKAQLLKLFRKKAQRKRESGQFNLELSRELAAWFGSETVTMLYTYGFIARPAAYDLAKRCEEAARRKAGKPPLTPAEIRERVEYFEAQNSPGGLRQRTADSARDAWIDEREYRRLKKRDDTNKLFEEIARSGYSILTWPGWDH